MALTHPSWTVDTTFSAKNIATAASVYTFTAGAAGKVQLCVKLTNAAGDGDYVIYLVHQWLGTGTAAVVLPKATCAAASGETVIEFISLEIAVKATDVVDVYIDGLAGDTSVNGAIRISADNPSVFQATDTVSTVTTLTGHTAQTGDAFLRLGAPAGASVSADIAAIAADVATIDNSGTYSYSNTVDDGSGNLLDGVFIQLATDSGFVNVVTTTHTNALGAFTVRSDTAGTHYLRLQLAGMEFADQTVTLA